MKPKVTGHPHGDWPGARSSLSTSASFVLARLDSSPIDLYRYGVRNWPREPCVRPAGGSQFLLLLAPAIRVFSTRPEDSYEVFTLQRGWLGKVGGVERRCAFRRRHGLLWSGGRPLKAGYRDLLALQLDFSACGAESLAGAQLGVREDGPGSGRELLWR